MSLHKKMAHGAMWSLLEKGGQQGLSFIVFMVLARLVGPEEYGLANICFIYFALTGMVVSGLVDGIVSLQVEDDKRLSSLFWTVAGIGFVISLLSVITAQPLAQFMEQPRLAGLIYSFSIIPFLSSIPSVPSTLILKEMNFKVFTIRTLVSSAIAGIVGVVMAYQGFGAYALVGQQFVYVAITNLIIWPCAGWRPRLMFEMASLREVVKPGLGMMGLNVLNFISGQAPRFLIAVILGPVAVGLYAFVIRLQLALVDVLISPPMSVLYPAFAKIKHDKKEQAKIAGKIMLLCGMALFPMLAIAAATAPIYVPLFFGEKWNGAILLLQIYIIGVASWPLGMIVRQLYRAHGKITYFVRLNVFVVLISTAFLSLLYLPDGLALFAAGVISVGFLAQPVYMSFLKRWIGIDLWHPIARVWPAAFSALLAYGSIYMLQASDVVSTEPAWGQLVLSAALGIVVYVVTILPLQHKQIKELIAFARSLNKKQALIILPEN